LVELDGVVVGDDDDDSAVRDFINAIFLLYGIIL
jgi:hypothetical protein